jgi:DNA polymerase phi
VFGDYIIAMIRRANTAHGPEENAWIESQALPHLASMAYSKIEAFTPPISERTRNIFRNRLHSALAHMIVSPNGFQYPCKLIKSLKSSAVDMDGNILAAKDRALGVMAKLLKRSKKAAEDEKRPLQALAMLYALVIFQLYDGEPDAVSLIDELEVCYEKVIYGNESLESGVNASVALVEILLSFMSKQSMLLRKIAQQVFSAFSGGFDEESLKLLVDVLESSENLKGQQELFDHADDELEHSESDQEMDSDVEVLDIDLINGRDESNVTTEDEEDDDDSNENEDEEESIEDKVEAQKLDDALAAALGTHRADQDINGESSDSDADMSDSEMMELDSKLIEIFSQRKKQPNKKQEKKDARENIINFKIRVLDLLEIYVKEQAASLLAFGLLPPLLKVIRTTSAKQISERAHNVITVFAKASKGLKLGEGSTTYDDRKLQVLKNIHEEGSKDQSHASKAASTASLLVATSLFRATKSNRQEIAKIYHETEDRWAEGKVKMQASFFHDWVNWCQSHVS